MIVIFESSYWRDHLHRQARFLRDKTTQKRWPEASFAKLEREVMIGFYSVRKLHEAQKISNRTFEYPVQLSSYRARGKAVGHLNWHRIDELYELSNSAQIEKPLSFIVNQLIHSFVFLPIFGEDGGVEKIAFNSDRTKGKTLYALPLIGIAEIFAMVAGRYLHKVQYARLTPDGELEMIHAEP